MNIGQLASPVPVRSRATTLLVVVLLLVTSCTEATGQRIEDYATARQVFWKQLYANGGETLYCQQALGSGYNKGVNIEHVFPMSWVAYSLRCGKRKQCRENSPEFNRIEADLHNLYPSRSDVNKARNNYRFVILAGESRPFHGCDFEFDERKRLAEPGPHARGKIARAMLYMREEYDLYLKPELSNLMKEWNRKYPPAAEEQWRNNIIESIQGNRNPWIDRHTH